MHTPLDDLVEELNLPHDRRAGWYAWGVLLVLMVGIPYACAVSAQTRPGVVFDCREFATYARSCAATCAPG